MRPSNKRTKRVTSADAVALHAEANKSDPFAAARMAMTMRNGTDKPKDVAEEAKRLIDGRKAHIVRDYKSMSKTPFICIGRTVISRQHRVLKQIMRNREALAA